ncbi:methyltransferase [Marinomonas hwangdonensis]|uniref:Methyltransferase n=1 Tax=Marinomonas hwangdonensis TaxID=1053647 RepID=A0A3M8Q893_9GAMM|nr:class I SAM-dependent methyltransferase [Marinomonas hwangdonensis]MDP5056707.1 class I SAM-dependent methyltransferase [Marinomonas hwangdonensis]RNF51921.1 methyltransferase [Marinomonas hwangdonensis]
MDLSHLDDYCIDTTQAEPDLLIELVEKTYSDMGYPNKLSGKTIGRTLKLLAKIAQPKRVLEIGMFTGYSALSIAEGMPSDGQLICCETNPRAIEFAQSFFDRSEHGKKIQVIFGPALETIKTLEGEFDFVFIDADKRNYLNYYEAVLPLVRSGGLIIIDNSLWQGRVLDPKENSDIAVNQVNRLIAQDIRVENVHLNVRDGLNIVVKH